MIGRGRSKGEIFRTGEGETLHACGVRVGKLWLGLGPGQVWVISVIFFGDFKFLAHTFWDTGHEQGALLVFSPSFSRYILLLSQTLTSESLVSVGLCLHFAPGHLKNAANPAEEAATWNHRVE